MRNIALIAGLAISMAALPVAAQAACEKRTLATMLGGLLGQSRSDQTAAAPAGDADSGALGDPVSTCKRGPQRTAYDATSPPRTVYSDAPRHAAASSCRFETRPFHDVSGQVVSRPTRVCGRF